MVSTETKPNGDAARPLPRVRVLPLAILAGLMVLVAVTGVHRFGSLDAVVDVRDRFQSLVVAYHELAMLVFALTYVAAVSLSLPGAILLTLLSGLMFGWLAGGILSLCAATVGASIVFTIARTSIGDAMGARAGPQVAKLQAGFCDNALSYMLFLRLVPVFPFFAVNIAPALLGVPFRTFVVGTFFGIMPASFAYSSAGAGLDSTIKAARAAQLDCVAAAVASECPLSLKLATLITPELKIAFLLLSILALIPAAFKLWRRQRGH